MKKLLLTFSLAAMLLGVKAQLIITGYMADPGGSSLADGNYEYIQLMATETITFNNTDKAFSLVISRNATADAPYAGQPAKEGWATAGVRTYKFNITSGTITKGQFYYVGGANKKLNGATSKSIPDEKWLVARDYSTVVSDSFVGNVSALAVSSGIISNSGRASGIAIFNTTAVSPTTVPIDVVFATETTGGVLWLAGPPAEGYLICKNDLYDPVLNPYFRGDGKNTAAILNNATTTANNFIKLGGVYDLDGKEWTTARSTTPTTILLNDDSEVVDIETGTGTTTLPVSLTTFTAKATKQGTVNLNWATASEQNNSHFEVNRSTDATNFTKIGEVAGNGTTNTAKNYNYTDNSPAVGVNYYQLKQVDNDGKSALSGVVSAKVGLSQNNVSVSAGKAAVTVNYKALGSGKATFTVYSVSGAKLASATQNVSVGANQVNIPVQLGNSLHLLQVQQAGESVSVKF